MLCTVDFILCLKKCCLFDLPKKVVERKGTDVLLILICIFHSSSVLYYKNSAGLVETDPEAALAGFAEVVEMEPEKAEW